jgi:hypothetical protein
MGNRSDDRTCTFGLNGPRRAVVAGSGWSDNLKIAVGLVSAGVLHVF